MLPVSRSMTFDSVFWTLRVIQIAFVIIYIGFLYNFLHFLLGYLAAVHAASCMLCEKVFSFGVAEVVEVTAVSCNWFVVA